MKRGHLHRALLDKWRPVVVISPEWRNQLTSDVIVIPCSSRQRLMSTHVALRTGEGGLPRASDVKCEQVTTLSRELIDPYPLGPSLSSARLREIEEALVIALGFGLR